MNLRDVLRIRSAEITDEAVQGIVRYYTRESGVRNLEREVAKICRKVVKEIAMKGPQPATKRKPKPIQVNAFNDSDWRLNSNTKRFTYRAE